MRTALDNSDATPALRLEVRAVEGDCDPEVAFQELFGCEPHAFWLDSAQLRGDARFSYMGAPGPLGFTVSYDVERGEVRVERGGGAGRGAEIERDRGAGHGAKIERVDRAAGIEVRRESIFDYLERESRRQRPRAPDLPFEFRCGFVGYLGYELKAECGGEAAHRASTPDAAFLFADRVLAFDHQERRTYLLALSDEDTWDEARHWLATSAARLQRSSDGPGEVSPGLLADSPTYRGDNSPTNGGDAVELGLGRARDAYLGDIAACKRALRAGESYEICLTNRVTARTEEEPFELYRALRRANPAPHAAFLRFGGTAVLSSSPERFLRVGRDGVAEARPIKGTSRRGAGAEEDARLARALRADGKSRAENVTIVDLLRNDLGRVCEFGSVEVTGLMELETYKTVHQLVSTIRGRLRPEISPAACARACFPPGSMTGAPKPRTMAILDRLEGEARGVYSGAIGWFGLGGGCDLSVAIRTIVLEGERASIGAGGAIVIESDPELEYEEMLLKAQAPLRALDPSLPADYRRIRFSASTSRVTPRKSITSEAAATSAG
jgi:para-aminobenzoate synthetase